MNAKLIRAVRRQLGGTKKETTETLRDVAAHGADAGFHGFIYYSETAKFFRRNRALILESLEESANDCGESVLSLVAGFRCLNRDYTQDDIARVLYGPWKDDDAYTQIANALAWYALETVAFSETEG